MPHVFQSVIASTMKYDVAEVSFAPMQCVAALSRGSDVMPERHPALNKRRERVLEAGARPTRSRSGRNVPAWLDL